MGVSALFNIILNLFLIPKLSYIGASIATVFTECIVFTLMFFYISKYFIRISITENISKTIISGIITVLFIYYLKMNLNWIFVAILGVLFYVFLLVILKIITKEDIEILKKIF